jgi:triacylglycerol lipase
MKQQIIGCAAKATLIASAIFSMTSAYAHDPVIMIPGMTGIPANMDTMQSYLNSHGWPSNILFEWTDTSDMEQDMAVAAQQLSTEVQTVLSQTGAKHVVLASWSAGTLATRYYIKNLGGAAYVSQYISFSGPHHGTTDNGCQTYVSCQEFASPTTPFLTALNATTEVPGHPPIAYLTFRSVNDVNVLPTSSAELAGADNILLTGAMAPTHFTIINNTTALADMVNFIIANEPGGSSSTTTLGGTTTTTKAGTTTTTTATTTTTTIAGTCYDGSNYALVTAGRAHDNGGGTALANGSNQSMGLDNLYYTSKLRMTGSNYYIIDSTCP